MSTAEGVADGRRTPAAVRRLRQRKRELQRADPRGLLPRVGSTVGGFLLEERLGAGGFGTVFRARRGPHLYALKFLYLPRTGRWGRRELEVLLRVPLAGGLLSVEGHGYWPDDTPLFLYLALPYVRGSRLFVWARRARPCARQVACLVLELARQLRTVHQAGVVHRDVKGDNVLVHGLTGKPVLVDFGVGTYPGAPEVTGLMPPGTARYRSPESLRFRHQCRPGERYPASPRDDLWALGVLLYVLLTGTYPFDVRGEDVEEEEAALEALILHASPVAPHERNAHVPRALSELCLRLLEKAPEARYASAGAVCEALEGVLEGAAEEAAWEVPLVEGVPAPEVLEEASEEEAPALETEPPEALSSAGELPLQSLTEKEEAPAPDAPEPSPPTGPRALPMAAPPPTPIAASVAQRVRGVGWAGVALGLGALLGALLLAPGQAPLKPTRAPGATGSDFSGQEVAPPWRALEGGPGAAPPWAVTPAPVAPATPSEDMRVKTSQPTPSPQEKPPKRKTLRRSLKAAGLATCTALAGCPAAQVLPNPPAEPCPPGAVEAMEKAGLLKGYRDTYGRFTTSEEGFERILVRPGSFTFTEVQGPIATLSGRLLFGEGRVYGRFTQATLNSGESIPVCYELYDTNERKPGTLMEGQGGPDSARVLNAMELRAVERFE
jgi:serine/threonine-protein kinase